MGELLEEGALVGLDGLAVEVGQPLRRHDHALAQLGRQHQRIVTNAQGGKAGKPQEHLLQPADGLETVGVNIEGDEGLEHDEGLERVVVDAPARRHQLPQRLRDRQQARRLNREGRRPGARRRRRGAGGGGAAVRAGLPVVGDVATRLAARRRRAAAVLVRLAARARRRRDHLETLDGPLAANVQLLEARAALEAADDAEAVVGDVELLQGGWRLKVIQALDPVVMRVLVRQPHQVFTPVRALAEVLIFRTSGAAHPLPSTTSARARAADRQAREASPQRSRIMSRRSSRRAATLHDQQLRDGHTPLMWLASPGMNVDAARPVLVGGANVNQRDGEGRTALHWLAETRVSRGAEERAVGFLNLLLEYNVELNAVDSYGSTALDIARQEPPCPPLVAALLEAGAVGNSSAVSDAGADAPSREELQRRLVMVQEVLFEEREQIPDGLFVRLSDALVGRRRM